MAKVDSISSHQSSAAHPLPEQPVAERPAEQSAARQSKEQSAAKTANEQSSAKKSKEQSLQARQDVVSVDTATADTVAYDTTYVLVIDPPSALPRAHRSEASGIQSGMSWVVAALLMLFVVVAIRFHNNAKYLRTLLKSAVEVRERGNAFDDTVRETSFMVVLNVLWCICAGILLYFFSAPSPAPPLNPAKIGICIALAGAYALFMVSLYAIVGNVFSDRLHTRMWVRGYLAATGLTTLILFPCALLALCYPQNAVWGLYLGCFTFIIGKFVFISKGFRIFFTQIGSWVLFLYYLCSLEIVPLILLCVSAHFLST